MGDMLGPRTIITIMMEVVPFKRNGPGSYLENICQMIYSSVTSIIEKKKREVGGRMVKSDSGLVCVFMHF